jgi:hypothetical protein
MSTTTETIPMTDQDRARLTDIAEVATSIAKRCTAGNVNEEADFLEVLDALLTAGIDLQPL